MSFHPLQKSKQNKLNGIKQQLPKVVGSTEGNGRLNLGSAHNMRRCFSNASIGE